MRPGSGTASVFAATRLDLRLRVEAALEEIETKEAEADAAGSFTSAPRPTSEQARWLQLTEWTRFLEGHPLDQTARLIDLPTAAATTAPITSGHKPGDQAPDLPLTHILESFDRVIGRARQSLASGRLNTFDQHQLNSFIPKHSSNKPLFHQLREDSYRRYTRVFRQLLCFVYRRAWEKTGPTLHFSFWGAQSTALAETVSMAEQVAAAVRQGEEYERLSSLRKRLDDKCLVFCVSLLDHPLYGDIYDSLVVGFTAVLAIQETHEGEPLKKPRLSEAVRYTPYLSAIIKISQLLVAERALLAVERDEADYPAQALEDMQGRFMVYGTRSPICWVQKLRAYGKAIQDTTTSLGRISWSDDGEVVTYKTMQLTMTSLRGVVAATLGSAQQQLADLLLVHPDEDREAVVPPLSLRSLQDNPAESAPGWNFVQHPANTALHGYEKWLLNRVLDNTWLQKDFFGSGLQAKVRSQAVENYLSLVDGFLETLLLLVHVTGGQPARGTELLTIQHRNPEDGQGRRNIFLENGLVSFVTFYHKGYSISGSTKIIHRYLPIEVSELLVYYTWLVVPFVTRLVKLAKLPDIRISKTPYLWGEIPTYTSGSGRAAAPKSKALKKSLAQDQAWAAARLSKVLSSEFDRLAGARVDIQTWRHVAIAISRRHLQQAKFKRDFIEALSWAWNDDMAAHGTRTAGLIYARGINEAPGHVAGAKAEYRRICREWHAWIGFGGYRTQKSNIGSI
jgi:hypothetical protein